MASKAVCDVCGKEFAKEDTAISYYHNMHGGEASIHFHGTLNSPKNKSECPVCQNIGKRNNRKVNNSATYPKYADLSNVRWI